MDPNIGNFGAAIGGGTEIIEAMKRRGMGVGATSQISPAAPTAPENLPPAPVGSNPSSAVPQRQPQVLPQAGQPGGVPSPESSIIIKALDSRLKSLSKLQEMGMQV
jgi:hypothetical protein